MKKVFSLIMAFCLITVMLASCAQPPAAEPTTPPKVDPTKAPEAPKPTEPTKAPAGPKPFVDVGKQSPITILVHESPWYAGFEKTVKLYEQQTGNQVKLDVSPWAGVLEKARNSVRDKQSPYDIMSIDQFVIVEFYKGGFMTPLTDIDPTFKLASEHLLMNNTLFWNEKTQWRDDKGKILSFSPNGNVQFLFYRSDLFKEAGLKPPETWDDVKEACKKLHKPPDMYCLALGTEKGARVAVDFTSIMGGFGATIEKDAANGDFTVTINSPQAKQALDMYIDLLKNYGPKDYGAIGQSQLIQYMVTGKVAIAVPLATAAWPNMDNPQSSQVVGKVEVMPIPKPVGGKNSVFLGSWCAGIPTNIPDDRKKAAMAFAKWFLSYEAQYEYAKNGSVPVRSDVFSSDLSKKPEFRWFETYNKSIPNAVAYLGYSEGAQVQNVLGLRLNQAIIGEMTTAQALNTAAEEIQKIFKDSGRKTGMLEPLK